MRNGKFEGYLLVADFDDTFCPEHGAPVPGKASRAARRSLRQENGRKLSYQLSPDSPSKITAPLLSTSGVLTVNLSRME